MLRPPTTETRTLVVLTLVAGLLAGCSAEIPPPDAEPPPPAGPTMSGYDGTLEPAAAVLPLVPADATTLSVTDFDEVRALLGDLELTSAAPAAERRDFWQRAGTQAAMLSPGRLVSADERLLADYGFGRDDVAWEATFDGPGGGGWALRLADTVDMSRVSAAVAAGVEPLRGGEVDAAEHLVTAGTADDPDGSWGADPDLVALVGDRATTTYVSPGCVDPDGRASGGATAVSAPVDELDGYAVAVAGGIVTARLAGTARQDLFDRMRLVRSTPAASALASGVSDPSTSRIGYSVQDPPAVAALVRDQQLPFAVCA